MHGDEPLRDDVSLRDFNGGIGCHVTSVVEEALLLSKDMFELRSMRKNEVFLNCKRYLGMVKCQSFFSFPFFFLIFFIIIIYRCILFIGYAINPFHLGCPSHF